MIASTFKIFASDSLESNAEKAVYKTAVRTGIQKSSSDITESFYGCVTAPWSDAGRGGRQSAPAQHKAGSAPRGFVRNPESRRPAASKAILHSRIVPGTNDALWQTVGAVKVMRQGWQWTTGMEVTP